MMHTRRTLPIALVVLASSFLTARGQAQQKPTPLNLPTGKHIMLPTPGDTRTTSAYPSMLALSPDGRTVAAADTGYGTFESNYMQAVTLLDASAAQLRDTPVPFTSVGLSQVLSYGAAFSRDGHHLYVSVASTSVPEGGHDKDGHDALGNGIAVFDCNGLKLEYRRLLHIPLQPLRSGQSTGLLKNGPEGKAIPYPSGIAVVSGAAGDEELLVADNLSDDALLLDAVTGKQLARFDLSTADTVPAAYPLAVLAVPGTRRAFVTLWNAYAVAELDLDSGKVAAVLPLLRPEKPTAAGTHPSGMALSPDVKSLYVALANRDVVAVVDIASGRFSLRGLLDTRLPHQTRFGAIPVSVALSPDGQRAFVADMGLNAVAVYDVGRLAPAKGPLQPLGFIPTEWEPTAVAVTAGKLIVTTANGTGTGPNDMPQPRLPAPMGEPTATIKRLYRDFTYAPSLLHGTLTILDTAGLDAHLPAWSETVISNNRMRAAAESLHFASGQNPIRHVIYIIKENRTYDQVLGDLAQDGRPVGNGARNLAMYGADVTPNLHKLALQFGVFDNFYDTAEVSGQGHVWSNTAIGTDALDKTMWPNYRSNQRSYDYEGQVAEGFPMRQNIPDLEEPPSGYIWTNLAAHGKSYYHFAEYIVSAFCSEHRADSKTQRANPTEGPVNPDQTACPRNAVKPGEEIPAIYGGGVSKYQWDIPLLASNTPAKPELVGHFAQESPDFNLHVPDQFRVEVFLHYLQRWQDDLAHGHDTMPQFIQLRLPNDHTAGTAPGMPTPKSSVADNDLAVGRAVEAISNSPFWDSTAFFIVEDDSQNGPDHVDSHRSTAFVVSKYAPRGSAPLVDSRFYTTVSMMRTMESLLDLPPMNNNDAFASIMGSVFTGDGSQPAYSADYRNRDNNLIYTANQRNAPGARQSAKMDFSHADQADPRKLNEVLWRDAMGNAPIPAMVRAKPKKQKDDDD